jgi:tetratricopeptide (TPR) repeat protein
MGNAAQHIPSRMAKTKPDKRRSKSAALSTGKLWAFRWIALGLPFLLLAFAEGALRICGLGGYVPMLHEVGRVNGGTLVIADQGGAQSWFFANPDRPGRNEQYAFLHPKPANTVRIFVVGESAAQGYPQPRNLSSSAFLELMLQDAWPDRRIEVINLSATAIASFPVLGIMTEALDYEPDLVVIYTGHNEFFGTYGVASVGRAGSKPWMLKGNRALRSLALVQVADRLLRRKSDFDRTLMETMLGRTFIGADDWRRNTAANNLRHNISEMIRRCQTRGVPVLVCTLPTNERDLSPVGEDKLDALPAATQAEIESLLSTAKTSQRENPEAAIRSLQRVLELHPTHARAHFLLGQALMAQDKHTESLVEFIKARDLDSMPWRATTRLLEAVHAAANERNAPVCDLVKRFREASPGGAIGWELMDDHVHPNLRGQALIAVSILDSLNGFDGKLQLSSEARGRVSTRENYASRLGENIYDRYGVAHNMRTLFAATFLRRTNPEAYERFNNLAGMMEEQMSPEVLEVLREWQQTTPFAGARCPITAAVAQLRMKQDNYREALGLYKIALRGVPQYTSWYLEYVYYELLCKQKLDGTLGEEDKQRARTAIEQGRLLAQHVPSDTGFTERYTGLLCFLCREFAEAVPFLMASRQKLTGFDRVVVDQTLVLCHLKTGQFEKARALVTEGAASGGEHAARYQALLDQLPALMRAAAEAPSATNRAHH